MGRHVVTESHPPGRKCGSSGSLFYNLPARDTGSVFRVYIGNELSQPGFSWKDCNYAGEEVPFIGRCEQEPEATSKPDGRGLQRRSGNSRSFYVPAREGLRTARCTCRWLKAPRCKQTETGCFHCWVLPDYPGKTCTPKPSVTKGYLSVAQGLPLRAGCKRNVDCVARRAQVFGILPGLAPILRAKFFWGLRPDFFRPSVPPGCVFFRLFLIFAHPEAYTGCPANEG